jgi:hypothetical protein
MILFIDPAPAKNIRAGSINSKAGSKIQRREGILAYGDKKSIKNAGGSRRPHAGGPSITVRAWIFR